MNYCEHHIGDYAKRTRAFGLLEHGVYSMLRDRYFDTEQPIPAAEIYRQACASSKQERQAVDVVLAEFFKRDADVWRCPEFDAEIRRVLAKIDIARKNGRLGGRPPGRSRKTTEEKPTGFSSGSDPITWLEAHQTPDTRHQTPNKETETPPHLAGGRACEAGEVIAEDMPTDAKPTAAGLICRALRKAGIPDTNPGHPRLLALLHSGASEAEFLAFTPGACKAGAPFLWLLGAVEGERKRAAANASAIHQGAMPAASSRPAWVAEREAREARGAEWAGPFAAKKFQQPKPLEVIDADGKLLG